MPKDPGKAIYAGKKIFLVGIKGTGMSALAELLSDRGAVVSGSDTPEKFYTDEILDRLGIRYRESFEAAHIDGSIDLVAHSAAYSRETCPELLAATSLGIPLYSYPQMLGELSRGCDATGIAGVHGKSTTTALTGALIKAMGLPASVLVGAAVPAFGYRSTLTLGAEFFVAETCEYRRHFLSFHPDRIVITNVELDHTDFFSGTEDVEEAFVAYGQRLPPDGEVIYCADDPGAVRVVKKLGESRPGLSLVPYGLTATGEFRVTDVHQSQGKTEFTLGALPPGLALRIPGLHNVLNAAAAVAVIFSLLRKKHGGVEDAAAGVIAGALESFAGCRRRSEIVGERNGILFLDDYAHHPTAVSKTIAGYRVFYPGRRIVVDFMPHLYSRTKDLFDGFVAAFDDADVVILHGIYASAREKSGKVTGADLFREVKKRHPRTFYFEKIEEAEGFCRELLAPGDVFITMGAGDNWKLGRAVLENTGAKSD
ncbi:MAG: UDP-N-acetylmuramate--L-alanine ligase [Spirochaetales bacterium]|nr:UDP-N-acetylmuramate--L-alanine ligase [Spirochaetales bacterium]